MQRISLERARGLWLEAQHLSSPAPSAADAVRTSGWWHSAGGSTIPLALLARGVSIADGVGAVDREELVAVPGVRRSVFLVPREDAAVAVAASERSTRDLMTGAWRAAGVSRRAATAMKNAMLTELEAWPLSVGALAKRMSPASVRKTGSDGGALGLPSTVHLALRELQHEGQVVRISEDRRLDGDRYVWKRASLAVAAFEDPALDQGLVGRFIRWTGPATLKEIAWWAGMAQRAARVAIEALGCEAVEVEGWVQRAFVEPGRIDRKPTPSRAVVLLPFRDNYLTLRRGLAPLLSESAKDAAILDWRGKPATAGALDALHHPALVAHGVVVGIWEYDPDAKAIVWRLFDDDASRRSFMRAIRALERRIRDELRDARFYPFDSGPARRARIEDARA